MADLKMIRFFEMMQFKLYRARLLPFDAIRREQKNNMSIFRRSHVVVVSQSNRTQIIISITSVVVEYVVALSYRNRIVVESQCDIGFRPRRPLRQCFLLGSLLY